MKLKRWHEMQTNGNFHHPRPFGAYTPVMLDPCKCGDKQRGPKGGVCGNCGQAIPTDDEQKEMEKK